MNKFLSEINGGHLGYADCLRLIQKWNGELIGSRTSLVGRAIETWRVRFDVADVLLTFGRGAIIMGGKDGRKELPEEWEVVIDRVKKK